MLFFLFNENKDSREMELQIFGAAREVTGSCYMLTVSDKKILIDCGLHQGGYEAEASNYDDFLFNPHEIDAVVLTHAHLDHAGRLPLLVKRGFRGPIFTHHATAELCKIMLLDAAHLNERDIEIDNRKRARRHLTPLVPLYSVADAQKVFSLFDTIGYHEKLKITDNITIRLNDAGHILGAAIIEMWLKEGDQHRKIVFSGDIGHKDMPILCDPETVEQADLVIMECTYGNRNHKSWEETCEELTSVLKEAHRSRGNVLIPSFAIGRTQELLYMFHKHFTEWDLKHWHLYLDSPMAIEATRVYFQHPELYDEEAKAVLKKDGSFFKLPNLTLTQDVEESMRINDIESGSLIIAASGMCQGGRIRHHLKYNILRNDAHIIFIGFQAYGTLGRMIIDGAKEITLWGEPIKVAANIHTIGGLSAHAGRDELLEWYSAFEGHPPVVLIHGEEEGMISFANLLRDSYGVLVHTPTRGQVIDLFKINH